MARKARVSHAAGYRSKGVKVYVTVRRDVSTSGAPRFVGCAALKWHKPRHGYMPHVGPGWVCRPGRNPRKAMRSVLMAFARNIGDRRGTFAGMRP